MTGFHLKLLSGCREKAAWASASLSCAWFHNSSNWFSSCSQLLESLCDLLGPCVIPSVFLGSGELSGIWVSVLSGSSCSQASGCPWLSWYIAGDTLVTQTFTLPILEFMWWSSLLLRPIYLLRSLLGATTHWYIRTVVGENNIRRKVKVVKLFDLEKRHCKNINMCKNALLKLWRIVIFCLIKKATRVNFSFRLRI